jgi:hypothetical protein
LSTARIAHLTLSIITRITRPGTIVQNGSWASEIRVARGTALSTAQRAEKLTDRALYTLSRPYIEKRASYCRDIANQRAVPYHTLFSAIVARKTFFAVPLLRQIFFENKETVHYPVIIQMESCKRALTRPFTISYVIECKIVAALYRLPRSPAIRGIGALIFLHLA